jgi:phosphoglycerate dehydrogenase-like enzyme
VTKPLVLLWTDNAGPYRDAIAQAGLGDDVRVESAPRGTTPDDSTLADVEVLFAMSVPPGVLATMPKLRWIQSLSAGVEGWTARPDLRKDITLTCARGTHRIQMPENILGALFHITKPYAAIVGDQQEKRWARRESRNLAGATLGILGLGAIGGELARKAAALEMRVIGTRRTPKPMEGVAEVFGGEGTETVLRESDFVVLLLPATAATSNFINAERLALMKPSAWLINFGRGHIIDDAALIAAVNNKTIAGAVLDVFRKEPLPPEDPFWTTENIVVLPHIGGHHPERDKDVAALLAENLGRLLAGTPLREVVDPSVGY